MFIHYKFLLQNSTNCKPSNGQVEGLGIHKIKGRGTVNYTVMDNYGDQVNIIIDNALYVPTLNTILLPLQQLTQQ